ncbi:MAG: hypothetical protein P1U65_04955 [Minwuia sp.]|nr:hypothetical protein [Minwuia sp.]
MNSGGVAASDGRRTGRRGAFVRQVALGACIVLASCWTFTARAQVDTADQAREAFQDFAEFVEESEIARNPGAIKLLADSMKGLKAAHIAFAFLDLAMTLNDIAQGTPSDTEIILGEIEKLDVKVTRLGDDMRALFDQAHLVLVDEFRQSNKRSVFGDIEVRYQTVRNYQRRVVCFEEAERMRDAHRQRGSDPGKIRKCPTEPVAPSYSDTADDFFEIGKRLGLICKPLDNSVSVLRTVADRDFGNYTQTAMTLLQVIEALRKAQHVGVWMTAQDTYRRELLAQAARNGMQRFALLPNSEIRESLTVAQIDSINATVRRQVSRATNELQGAWSACEKAGRDIGTALMSRTVMARNVDRFVDQTFLSPAAIEAREDKIVRETEAVAREIGKALKAKYSAHNWVVVLVENLRNRWNGCPGGRNSNVAFNSSTLAVPVAPLSRHIIEVEEVNESSTRCGTFTIDHRYSLFVHGYAPLFLSDADLVIAKNTSAMSGGALTTANAIARAKGAAPLGMVGFNGKYVFSIGAVADYGLNRGIYVSDPSPTVFADSNRKALLVVAPLFREQ